MVLGAFWARSKPNPLGFYDQKYYLGMGLDLIQTGRFTDGAAYGVADASGQRPSGMRFVPLYPLLVTGAMQVEPAFRAAAECVMAHYSDTSSVGCANTAYVVRAAQFVMLVLIDWMIWWLGLAVVGSLRGAWIALGLALLAGPYLLGSVNYVMTETTSLLFSTAATCAAVAGLRSTRPGRWFALAGALTGLLTLTRPAFLYGGLAAIVAGLVRGRFAAVGLFAVGLALPLAPWIARNAVEFGRPSLSYGYDSHTLVQRISYDQMTWREYGLAYVCGLPDGTALGVRIAGPGACDRFGLDERPGTFYQIGIGPMLAETLQAAGGYDHHLAYLLREYIAKMPLWHLLVSIPMALRGAWVDHYWGLILGITCFVRTIVAIRGRDWRFLTVALPAWFMLAFHAAVAVNQVRYNLMLVPPYAVAGAAVADWWMRRRRIA